MKKRIGSVWYCPLYGKEIAEGKCLDINYERLGYMADGCIEEITRFTGKQGAEINKTCESCPNLPLDDGSMNVTFPERTKN